MKVLGISPLDKDATVSLVEDGRVLFAAGEERFSRTKQHAGFPALALRAALEATGTDPSELDLVAYPFLDAAAEARLMTDALVHAAAWERAHPTPDARPALAEALRRVPDRSAPVSGLRAPNERMDKSSAKALAYALLGASPALSARAARHLAERWRRRAVAEHGRWQRELAAGLAAAGVRAKLERSEHHLSHAANAYHASGFERALVVTLDGYGSGLAGSISLGEGGAIRRLHGIAYPSSLGTFYEMVTSSLGFHPDRHAGKIVGLAAYGDPAVLTDALLARFEQHDGDVHLHQALNVFFSRHVARLFPKVDVAAAWQHALEVVACRLVAHWTKATGCTTVVLSGGVTANVKMNQRIFEVDGVERLFVYPNMGDGGCGTGLAMHLSWPGGVAEPLHDVYLGPQFDRPSMRAALEAKGLSWSEPADMAGEIARRVHAGEVVGRFDGRMEYGPRALGNRSILYHASEPEVNQWLNKRLGRTEFMPFAPVTTWEARHRFYENLDGAEHAAEFMTVTFDCTEEMRRECPAAVHVDGTARPQLVKRGVNPGYHDVLTAYERLSGIPCLINTSFNMHEEPIVCSPDDAVRAFLLGRIDALALGPFLAEHPERETP